MIELRSINPETRLALTERQRAAEQIIAILTESGMQRHNGAFKRIVDAFAIPGRWCSRCRRFKHVELFERDSAQCADGLRHECRQCHRAYLARYYRNKAKRYSDELACDLVEAAKAGRLG